MLQLWQELVNVDCGSGNKAGVDFIAQKIEAILKNTWLCYNPGRI